MSIVEDFMCPQGVGGLSPRGWLGMILILTVKGSINIPSCGATAATPILGHHPGLDNEPLASLSNAALSLSTGYATRGSSEYFALSEMAGRLATAFPDPERIERACPSP